MERNINDKNMWKLVKKIKLKLQIKLTHEMRHWRATIQDRISF